VTLKHPKAPATSPEGLSVPPLFTLESTTVPRHLLSEGELPPDVAYQLIHDELMLDGNARLNVATFVTTWMEPQGEKLMAECFDKNMIDKDEYPQTAEIETRCVNILSRLWHAPDVDEATGCSTTGSSEAAMLGGLALKRRWQKRGAAEGKPADTPNLVVGINVQVCWEKFANYWDVEMRLVPMDGDRFHLSAEEAVKLCDENTIGVVAILGSTFDGSYEPIEEICDALDAFQSETGIDVPVHVDGASGAFVAPFVDPDLAWDFRLPRVASRKVQGYAREVATRLSAKNRRARAVRADHEGRRASGVRVQAAGQGRELHGLRRLECFARAAGRFRPTRSRRIGRSGGTSGRRPGGFTHDLADLLVSDIERQLPRLEKQQAPVLDSTSASGFHH
jgi:Pyridoxal-dependent decarboxylase conserved domain